MRLRFVSARGGSAFMHELLSVVAHEVSALGVATTLAEGPLPSLEAGDVYVVVPHEFFVVTPPSQHPTTQQLRRTIAFCVEHPGNETFETTVRWAAEAGRVVDISEDSTAALRSRGIPAEHFRLGYSSVWDTWHGDESAARKIDVVYLGTAEARRSRALASYAKVLAPRDVRLLMPPHEPMTATRPDFLMGSAKLEFLRGSKVLLNLHRGQSVALEWVRVLEALCNGCVVVSEHSADYEPLVPGHHIVFGQWRSIGELANLLLDDPDWLRQLRQDAYQFLTTDLTMRPSAERLVDVASDLSAGRPRRSKFRSRKATYNPNLPFALRTSTDAGEVDAPRPLPSVEPVARFALSRSLQQAASAASTNPLFTKSPARAVGSIDALVAQTSSDPSPVCTVASILEQDEIQDVRVLVGPADRTGALRLTGPLADDRVKVCDGDAGGSVGSQRNRLLVHSDAEFVLVLEPTDTLLPRALLRLVQLLQTTDSAAVCFPMTAESDGEIGNALPFEPRRLVTRDYLGAPALWRRDVLIALGGWCHEPALDSLENYDLWLRLAAAHGQALLLPQVLVRRRFHPQKPIRLADLDPAGAQQVLRSRSAAFTMDTGTPASSPEELL